MITKGEIIAIDPIEPDPTIIDRAAALLVDDGIIVAPTETRYGLLTRADRPQNLQRLYRLKERDLKAPMAVFVKDKTMLAEQAQLSEAANRLARRFLPGPLTLVVNANGPDNPPVVNGGKMGVRVSSSPLIKALADRVNYPITATSANKSGRPDPTGIEDAIADFGDQVDLYLDSGELDGPLSTVVDCTRQPVLILREGALSREEIEETVRGTN